MTAADTGAPSLGKATRVILGLGLPLLIGALSSSMAGAVDIAMMGYYGEADLAAVAGAAALFDILGGIVIASVTGHQILAARFAGREDPAGIRRSLRSSAIFCGGIALALALAVALAGRQLTALVVGGDRQLSAIGAQYLAARAPTMLLVVAFALLALIESEADRIEGDIAGLYDNWFIETCDAWVVPYIGDLLGVRGLSTTTESAFTQRGYVANTLAYRRLVRFRVPGWMVLRAARRAVQKADEEHAKLASG